MFAIKPAIIILFFIAINKDYTDNLKGEKNNKSDGEIMGQYTLFFLF